MSAWPSPYSLSSKDLLSLPRGHQLPKVPLITGRPYDPSFKGVVFFFTIKKNRYRDTDIKQIYFKNKLKLNIASS